jgi:hypothetical protein
VVLFMTHARAADVPGDEQRLACLLPLGSASFAERVMDSCALAGVRALDVVVSEHPEAVRHLLQDGAPWGIRMHWHHAKDGASPYKVLRGMALAPSQRVVMGHAHQWVASRILRELVQSNGVALHMTGGAAGNAARDMAGDVAGDVAWSGWFSADASAIAALGAHHDYASLALRARSLHPAHCVIAQAAEHAQSQSAVDVLAAQQHALDGTQEAAIPASWLQMPWGAASPDAVVHPDAVIQGPVLIGPACVVEAGAELGPGTVLARDVYVARGARVRHALVMANTYIGGQITLEQALAQGHSIQSLKWSVRTVLSADDAVMAPLRSRSPSTTPWMSRALALLAALVVSPVLLPALLWQWLSTTHSLWRTVDVVQSRVRVREQDRLMRVPVRLAHSAHRLDRWVAHFGALLDIVQGRRNWIGRRPRPQAEWYALGRDWQELFGRTAIGLFHARAWSEIGDPINGEACAAADAFMAVQPSLAGRVKILYGQAMRSR